MPTERWTGTNPGVQDAFEVVLYLAPSRTIFLSTQVIDREDSRRDATVWLGVVVWVPLPDVVRPGEPVTIELAYRGERPTIRKGRFGPAERDLHAFDARRLSEAGEAALVEEARGLWNAYKTCREQEIQATRDARLRAQKRYFLELDWETSSATTMSEPERQADIGHVDGVLMSRLMGRVRGEAQLPLPLRDGAVARISALLVSILAKHFPHAECGLDAHEIDAAFVAFSTGQLAADQECEWNGRPDSAKFFFFAEFALLALACGANVDVWERLLPIFVKCEELYVLSFPPLAPDPPPEFVDVARRTFASYEFTRVHVRPDAAVIAQVLAETYRLIRGTERLSARHVENARNAFPLAAGPVPEHRHSSTEGHTMDKTINLLEILRNVSIATGNFPSGDILEEKWAVVRLDGSMRTQMVFRERKKAEDAAQEDEVVVGPLRLVVNPRTESGWRNHIFERLEKQPPNLNMSLLHNGNHDTVPLRMTPGDGGYETFLVVLPFPQEKSPEP